MSLKSVPTAGGPPRWKVEEHVSMLHLEEVLNRYSADGWAVHTILPRTYDSEEIVQVGNVLKRQSGMVVSVIMSRRG